jgi:hypothetical protein
MADVSGVKMSFTPAGHKKQKEIGTLQNELAVDNGGDGDGGMGGYAV